MNSKSRCCRLSPKDTIKAVAAILIPIMIGVFTLVLAWQEQTQGQANRQNDIELANGERTALIQLEEFRRDQDRQLATAIHMDEVLSTFYKEMSELILENNATLGDAAMRQTFVRPKILAALRQLDPVRKTSIIKYLYESGLLSVDNNPLDLSSAGLSNIDLSCLLELRCKSVGKRVSTINMQSLSLPDVNLENASFVNRYLLWSNFEGAYLTGANFRGSLLRNSIFYQTNLSFTDFTDASTLSADFEEADLTGSNISEKQLNDALVVYGAILPNGQTNYKRINRLVNETAKNCSLNQWQVSDIDIIHLLPNESQCAFRGRTSNATMTNILYIGVFYSLIDKNSAWITFELDVQEERNTQSSVNPSVDVSIKFLNSSRSLFVIDKNVNFVERTTADDTNVPANFSRWKGVTLCPSQTRYIEIEIKLTSGTICNNLSLYVERPRKSPNEDD